MHATSVTRRSGLRPSARRGLGLLALGGLLGLVAGTAASVAQPKDGAGSAARGEYVFHAAGCASCHSQEDEKGPPLAGGLALKTPYGTFYTPNITPDPVHGIGKWSEADFRRAMKEGVAPDGRDYYPAFPYTSYTGMSDQDVGDLFAYLKTQSPSDLASKPHELDFPYSWRFAMGGWKLMFFKPGRSLVQPGQAQDVARGAYLVGSLTHCGECHTPRNFLGALDYDRWLSGAEKAATGTDSVPNITPDAKTGIGDWTEDNIVDLLTDGSTPDGDRVGGEMVNTVRNSTSQMTDEDRKAIARYLKTVKSIEHATP
jgi:mono/diheme cytochrome c family protein